MSFLDKFIMPEDGSLDIKPVVPTQDKEHLTLIKGLMSAPAVSNISTIRTVNPSIAEMTANAMAGIKPLEVANNNLIQDIVVSLPEEIVPVNTVAEPKIIPSPKLEEEIVDLKPKVEIAPSPLPLEIHINEDKASVQGFLAEVTSLIKVGKELDMLLIQRKEKALENQKTKVQAEEAISAAGQIGKSISDFLIDGNTKEQSKNALTQALESYQVFLNAFNLEMNEQDAFLRSEDNKLVVKINAAKKSVEKMMQEVGGLQNFEKIKSVFKLFNNMRQQVGGYDSKLILEAHNILDRSNNLQDSAILKQLAASNNLLGILELMYKN